MAAISAIMTAACNSGSTAGEQGADCVSDEDCAQGLICNSVGQCITVECISDPDCGENEYCREDHRCNPLTADGDAGCSIDSDCPSGFTCVVPGNYCAEIDDGCENGDDCPPGQYCAPDGRCHNRNEADVDVVPTDGDDAPDGDLPTDGDESDGDTPPDGDPADEDPEPSCDMSVDTDDDGLPDCIEDKNHNGRRDPDETDLNDPDTDDDGLLDGVEDRNHDGTRQFNETDPLDEDTDFDRLKDGEEDTNANGQWDPGVETDPHNPDTDQDNVIDGNELTGGYTNGDSDPLDRDTDDDTLPDGAEDKNGNGTYEPELGETDPTLVDSDDDGTPDNLESVILICQDSAYTELNLLNSFDGNWTLALLPAFAYVELDLLPNPGEKLFGAAFEHQTESVAGFIVAKPLASGRVANQVAADNALLAPLPSTGGLNHRGRIYQSYDGFEAMTSRYTVTVGGASVGALRNRVLGLLANRNPAAISALPAGPAETGVEFEILTETLVRLDDGTAITIAAVLTKAHYDDRNNPEERILATDLTDGSAVAQSQRGTFSSCDADIGKPSAPVDFLWVVDDSGSMSEDQQAVADAASLFGQIMASAGIDFRVGVTSTDCAQGELGDNKFTRDTAQFQSDVQDPPCGSSEYGLRAGQAAINHAQNSGLPERERLRAEASIIVIFLSDEEDQQYQDCLPPIFPGWPGCDKPQLLNGYKDYYKNVPTTAFAIVGDTPDGCGNASEGSGQGSGEAGSAYIEVAYHTGGVFGSICAPNFRPIMEEILRAAAGTASTYELRHHPISSSIRAMVDGTEVPRHPTLGFEYDVVSETVVFYGDSRPEAGRDVVISYRYFRDDPKQ
ncbi:MAG: hypothetical protein C4523_02225 [Myxococcales bacterium]|nr:MAG: hypothetical protein C4523_02225 [Myxococcales bacterium]